MVDPIRSQTNVSPSDDSDPPSGPVTISRPIDPRAADAALDAAYARMPDTTFAGRPSANDAATQSVAVSPTLAARSQVIQGRLDAFRASTSGPYRVDGAIVQAPAFFRMAGAARGSGLGAGECSRDLVSAAIHAQLPAGAIVMAQLGRSTPSQLTRLTQGLIDIGKLPPGEAPVPDRIRAMQYQYGIGMDCAGYAQQALFAAQGVGHQKLGLDSIGMERFDGLAKNPSFHAVAPTTLRAGDVGVLQGATAETGHRVIVYASAVATAEDNDALTQKFGPSVNGLLATGEVHVIQVDSSWGSGGGQPFGGVKRETWLYSQATHQWGHQPRGEEGTIVVDKNGPYSDRLQGFYRSRGL